MLVISEIVNAIITAETCFGKMNLADRKSGLKAALERIYSLKGLEPTNVDYIVDEAEYKIAHAWPMLTIGEIQIALEAGVQGEFKKVGTVISAATCIGWLNEFYNSEERKAAREKIHYQKSLLSRDEDLKEIHRKNQEFEREGPQAAYEEYLKDGRSIVVVGYAAALYDALMKHGKINPTPQTRAKAEQAARATMTRTSGHGFAALAQTGKNAPVFEAYVKQELLYSYFENLKQRNVSTIKIN